jgi:4'-phosphopantetheinyl transferase
MLEAYCLKLDRELNEIEYEGLLSLLPYERQARIKRFRFYKDAQRSLLGDILARYLICTRINEKNHALEFDKNEYGKPHLVSFPDINFNITHSGDWVACAIDGKVVGIDVETIRPIDFKIAERFFSKDEVSDLFRQPEDERLNYFYKLWTLKESYIKAEGMGLSIPLGSFSMKISPDSILVETEGKIENYAFAQFKLDETHMFALCSHSLDYNFRRLNIDEFINIVYSIK